MGVTLASTSNSRRPCAGSDHAGPRIAALDGAPEVGEGLFRHVGMAHDVVGRAHQLFARETADLNERRVGVDDAAARIRAGNQILLIVQRVFLVVHRLVVAHASVVL